MVSAPQTPAVPLVRRVLVKDEGGATSFRGYSNIERTLVLSMLHPQVFPNSERAATCLNIDWTESAQACAQYKATPSPWSPSSRDGTRPRATLILRQSQSVEGLEGRDASFSVAAGHIG